MYQFIGCGAVPHFLKSLSSYFSGNGWFAGALLAGILSTNISNLLALTNLSGVIWMLLNGTPILLITLVVFVRKDIVSLIFGLRAQGS
jgi:hypothetical protein